MARAFSGLMGVATDAPANRGEVPPVPRPASYRQRQTLHEAIEALTKRLGPAAPEMRRIPDGRKDSDATPRGARVLAFTPSPRTSPRSLRLENQRAAKRQWRARLIAKAESEGRKSWRYCHERVRTPVVLPTKRKAA